MTDAALPLAMAALSVAGIVAGYRVGMVLAGSSGIGMAEKTTEGRYAV